MKLYRVAQKFAIKLAAEEKSPKERIKDVYEKGMELTNPKIIQLWLDASDLAGDGAYEELITDPFHEIQKLIKSYYRDAVQYGMTEQTNTAYIQKLIAEIDKMEKRRLDRGLDPRANGLFGAFREAVYAVPKVAIPRGQINSRPTINLPEQRISQQDETGLGYSEKPENKFPETSGPFGMKEKDRWE